MLILHLNAIVDRLLNVALMDNGSAVNMNESEQVLSMHRNARKTIVKVGRSFDLW